MGYEEYRRICALREAAEAAEAATEPASASPQDQPVEAAKEEPASGDETLPPSPAPSPSPEGEGSCEESTPEPTPDASRSQDGSDATPDPQPHTEPSGVPTQDWLARGLKHPAGRGWDRDAEPSPCEGRDLPRSGASPDGPRPQSPLGLTQGQPTPDRFESIRKFGLAARVRFLDCLATLGEVRAAAARSGISHETAYRARRRYPDFARLWDAAMVHARARAEGELATRALDGVEVPIIVRGEQVGAWRRHDARYLLTHLARLDRHVEAHPEAAARAERFDEMLAAMAGHEMPEHFAEACPEENIEGVPPTREAFVEHVCGQALDELDQNGEEIFEDEEERVAAEAEAIEGAIAEAGAEHDLWVAGSFARLDGVLEGEDECEGEGGAAADDAAAGDVPLIEYKAIMSGSAFRAKLRRGVSHVSTGGSWSSPTRPEHIPARAGEGRADASPPFVIPAEAGAQSRSEPTGSPLPRG